MAYRRKRRVRKSYAKRRKGSAWKLRRKGVSAFNMSDNYSRGCIWG